MTINPHHSSSSSILRPSGGGVDHCQPGSGIIFGTSSVQMLAIGIALAGNWTTCAGPVTLTASGPMPAVEHDDPSTSIFEVKEAIKCFEKRDFDACLKQLAQARKAHPELAPPMPFLPSSHSSPIRAR